MLPSNNDSSVTNNSSIGTATNGQGEGGEDQKIVKEIYKQNFELSIRNKTLSILRSLYTITQTDLPIDQMAQRIVDEVVSQLNFSAAIIAIVDLDQHVLRPIAITQNEQVLKSVALIGASLSEAAIPLDFDQNLAITTLNTGKMQITGNMLDILVPKADQRVADEIEHLTGIKTLLLYPLFFGQKKLGVLTIGIAKKAEDLSRAEQETLEELIDIITISLDRAKLLEDLRNLNDRLKELDQLKSEFVSVASHELRTPMTAIKSYLWMALAGKGGMISDKQKYYLERAYISTDRLIKLVNDLLNVSRIESGKLSMEPVKLDMGQFVDEVISEVKPRADEVGVKIINAYSQSSPLPPVLGDSDKLKEVLINIIGNSLKFTDKDGTISFTFEAKGNFVTTRVKDTGEGISPEDLPKLFQKFGLVKESYVTNQKASQGTGLGLYISKAIIELHRGQMWAESEGHGKGATFCFTLPIYTQEAYDLAMKDKKENALGIIHSTID